MKKNPCTAEALCSCIHERERERGREKECNFIFKPEDEGAIYEGYMCCDEVGIIRSRVTGRVDSLRAVLQSDKPFAATYWNLFDVISNSI